MPDKEAGLTPPTADEQDMDAEFAELVRHYQRIPYPKVRAAILSLMKIVAHMDSPTALVLIDDYFPLADMIREQEQTVY